MSASDDHEEAWERLIHWLERHIPLAEARGYGGEANTLRAVLGEMNNLAPPAAGTLAAKAQEGGASQR